MVLGLERIDPGCGADDEDSRHVLIMTDGAATIEGATDLLIQADIERAHSQNRESLFETKDQSFGVACGLCECRCHRMLRKLLALALRRLVVLAVVRKVNSPLR